MIARDSYLQHFVRKFSNANGGKAFYTGIDNLGEMIFEDLSYICSALIFIIINKPKLSKNKKNVIITNLGYNFLKFVLEYIYLYFHKFYPLKLNF